MRCKCGQPIYVPEDIFEPDTLELNDLEGLDGEGEGATVAVTQAKPRTCKGCGLTLREGARVCVSCGTDQRTGKPVVAEFGEEKPQSRERPTRSRQPDPDGPPPPDRTRMTLLWWGITLQVIYVVTLVGSLALAFASTMLLSWSPTTQPILGIIGIIIGFAVLAAAALALIGTLLCLSAPTPILGRLFLGLAILCTAAAFGTDIAAATRTLSPFWEAVEALAGTGGFACFAIFLLSLARYLGFDEVTGDASLVATLFGIVFVCLAVPIVVTFATGGGGQGFGLLACVAIPLMVWAVIKYIPLIFDLQRAVSYRRSQA